MMRRIRLVVFVGFVSLGLTGKGRSLYSSAHQNPFHPAEQPTNVAEAYKSLPMSFEPNRGQFDSSVSFGSERPSYSIFLKSTGATLKMRSPGETHASTLQMTFQGANERSTMRGLEPSPGVNNYYFGKHESWITNVPFRTN